MALFSSNFVLFEKCDRKIVQNKPRQYSKGNFRNKATVTIQNCKHSQNYLSKIPFKL